MARDYHIGQCIFRNLTQSLSDLTAWEPCFLAQLWESLLCRPHSTLFVIP